LQAGQTDTGIFLFCVKENPCLKLSGKKPNHGLFNLTPDAVEILWSAQLFSKRSDPFIGETAGIDKIEKMQVGVDVECKTMHGNMPAGFNADGTNLTSFTGNVRIKPYARCSGKAFALQAVWDNRQFALGRDR